MTSIEHKWYKDIVNQKGRASIIFSIKRLNNKQIAKLTPEQKKLALRNVEQIEGYFTGFIAELKDLLKR
jgi:hypothetical protein